MDRPRLIPVMRRFSLLSEPPKQSEKTIMTTLRQLFSDHELYVELLDYVIDNLQELANHQNFFLFSETMQEILVVLAMKSVDITDVEKLESHHINEVVCDMLLKAAQEQSGEIKSNWYGIYKSHLGTSALGFHKNMIDLVVFGKERLRRNPLM